MQNIDELIFFEDNLPAYETDVDAHAEIKNFPNHMQKFYNQLLNPTEEKCPFFEDLQSIVNGMSSAFKEEPRVSKFEWQVRKKEYDNLKAALKVASTSKEYLLLFLLCRSIARQQDSNRLIGLTGWGALKDKFIGLTEWGALRDKIANLVNQYLEDDRLLLALYPIPNDNYLRQRYTKLVVDYHIVYQKMLKMETELSKQKMGSDSTDRVLHYVRLVSLKEQVIRSLENEKLKLEQQMEALEANSKKQTKTATIYIRQNQKLIAKLQELSKKLEGYFTNINQLVEENKLLRLQLENLRSQMQEMVHSSQTKGDKIKLLIENNKKLSDHNQELTEEVRRLKGEISEVSSHLQKKSKELVGIKANLNKVKTALTSQTEEDIANFLAAADKNSQISLYLSTVVLPMLNDVNKNIENAVLPALNVPIKQKGF